MADKSVSTESLALDDSTPEYSGKKLRVAFIGCGGISQTHRGAMLKMPELEIVAGCDIDPKRMKRVEDDWGVPAYEKWDKMLAEVKPDVVSVCTPNGVHAAPTIDACKAGAHVIVEKPMAMKPEECEEMIAAAKKSNVKLCIGFQYRYHPKSQALKKIADDGGFGNIMFMKCQALRRRGIPNWGVFGQKELQGGGPMIDIGVHVIEMAHYVMGSPKPVAAMGNTWTYMGDKPSQVASQWPNWDYKTYTVEDLAIGQIRFDNGAMMQIEASFAAHIKQDVWNFTLVGDKGGASWDPTEYYTDQNGYMMNMAPGFLPRAEGAFGGLFNMKIQNFIDSILKGTEMTAPGEAGLAVQKILDGVYRSSEAGGKEVEIG